MGFLDHSTSNVIVDAVLTDIGRQFLAKNDGSFSIVKFAFADDEVDYTMIKKFGRVIGKEKIEKNTPIFEAQTLSGVALKYKSVSLSNTSIIQMPTVSLTGTGLDDAGTTLSMAMNSSTSTRQLTFSQEITDVSVIDVELRDQQFLLKLPNLFVEVVGASADYVDKDNVAYYTLTRSSSTTAAGGAIVNVTLSLKSITDTQFSIYGTTADKTVIKAVASLAGLQSASVKDFNISISK